MTAFAELEGEDAYELLGVSPEASRDEIHRAWRRRASTEHPDRVTDPRAKARAEERLRLLNAARDILASDRAAYDAHRDALRREEPAEEIAADPWDIADNWDTADPWDTAAEGRPDDDPWATATVGRPRPAPPPPPPPPPPRPPRPHPGVRVPPPPGQTFHAPRRRREVIGARLGIGCAVIFGTFYVLFLGLALVGLLRPSRPAVDVAVPSDLAGTWVGTAKERKGEKETWDVRLTLKSGKEVGEVRYLEGRCTGKAVPISLEGGTLTVRTDFAEDSERCDVGNLHLKRRKDGKVSLVYYKADTKTKSATAVLRRP